MTSQGKIIDEISGVEVVYWESKKRDKEKNKLREKGKKKIPL